MAARAMDLAGQCKSAMDAFSDLEIRNTIMEYSEPSTFFSIVSASPDALRSFKHYPKTFFNTSMALLKDREAQQARRLIRAMLTKPSTDGFFEFLKEEVEDQIDNHTLAGTRLDYVFLTAEWAGRQPPLQSAIADPVRIMKRISAVKAAVDLLADAPIWSFSIEQDAGGHPEECPLALAKNLCRKDTLWYFELYCELFLDTADVPKDHDAFSPRHGSYKFLNNHLEHDRYEDMPYNFFATYVDLFDMLEDVYVKSTCMKRAVEERQLHATSNFSI